jgi:hypothetical protein
MIGEGSGMRLRSLIMKEGVGRLEKYILEKICFSLERKDDTLLFCKLICRIEKKCLTLHRQFETGV